MARILVIDDETNIRRMVALALEQVGHTVDSAADGPEGIAKFGDGSACDLVLLDQRMPEMEGLEVLKELRRRSPNARIMMITAFGTIDLAVDAMKAGATDFLRKPFTVGMLRGAVQSSLALDASEAAPPEAEPARPAVTYWAGRINGYSIQSTPDAAGWGDGGLRYAVTVRGPSGDVAKSVIVVPAHVVEQIKSHAGSRQPGTPKRFWRMLCEHIVANYVWQNAEPPGGELQLDGLNKDLAIWIDSIPLA